MKRIELTKFGFIRDKSEDFSDDGNRFTCYRVGDMRVSKLVSDGDAFIDADKHGGILFYEEYSALPHYKDLGRLNGVSVDYITEEDLQKLYDDCVAYEKEYKEAESKLVLPTKEELSKRYTLIYEAKKLICNYVVNFFNQNATRTLVYLDDYYAKDIVRELRYLCKHVAPPEPIEKIVDDVYSRNAGRYVMTDPSRLKPCYEANDIIEKVCKAIGENPEVHRMILAGRIEELVERLNESR